MQNKLLFNESPQRLYWFGKAAVSKVWLVKTTELLFVEQSFTVVIQSQFPALWLLIATHDLTLMSDALITGRNISDWETANAGEWSTDMAGLRVKVNWSQWNYHVRTWWKTDVFGSLVFSLCSRKNVWAARLWKLENVGFGNLLFRLLIEYKAICVALQIKVQHRDFPNALQIKRVCEIIYGINIGGSEQVM